MDLTKFAVRFDNLEERREIESRFEESGYEIWRPEGNPKDIWDNGWLRFNGQDISAIRSSESSKYKYISYQDFISLYDFNKFAKEKCGAELMDYQLDLALLIVKGDGLSVVGGRKNGVKSVVELAFEFMEERQ